MSRVAGPAADRFSGHDVISPVTGAVIARIGLAQRAEIDGQLADLNQTPFRSLPVEEVLAFLQRLRQQILDRRQRFYELAYLETGFIARDTEDIVESAIDFLRDFGASIADESLGEGLIRHSYSTACGRVMRIAHRPFGCIAAIVPQNASLTLSVIIIASALYAGCRLILRPALQSAATGALLADAIADSQPPPCCLRLVNSLATDFIEACCASASVDLVHYIGSNRYALSVLSNAFEAGKLCLVDGQGNGLLFLDKGVPIQEAVRLITLGATRFNGQTCTSVNGVLVHEDSYDEFREAIVRAVTALRTGHPLDSDVQVGPLFSEEQARALEQLFRSSSGLRVLCGGRREGAYIQPAVLEGVEPGDQLVREGFSGPALWIRRVREGEQWAWLRSNRFPLSDTILSARPETIRTMLAQSKAARICVNADPSVESMFEPWGGYPPSGLNPVSRWAEKYRQAFLLDGELEQIKTLPTDV